MNLRVLSENQYNIIDSQFDNMSPRNAAIIALLLHCGLRNMELCQLNWSDVETLGYIKNKIYVRASGNHTCTSRHVPVPIFTMNIIGNHRSEMIKKNYSTNSNDPVFISLMSKGRLIPRDIQRIVDSISMEYLSEHVTPHTLRHTYATRLLTYTNLRVVQLLLGHKSLVSTQIYTHPTSVDCVIAVNKAFNSTKAAV